ncbi:MAG: two-component system, NtrC family, response regulator PilR [Acidobacteriota bacterium]|jgi:two-component system response regulator PilR (NtrC family)|nr:two-component system, NtrC family, response regulator PilR [Acidobacteriota bacterium]
MAAILIVDDDQTIRDTLYDLFSERHLCHVAETAEQALIWLADDAYDVVITDISMPGMSGVELVGYVRQQQPHTPVIIISGINDEGHAQGLLTLGVFAYVLKPFRLEEVEAYVEGAIKQRRLWLEESNQPS